jgi:excisionase family DNA binding protein
MKPEEDILTIEEVARYLKMKPQTIYKWAQEGQIPGAKLGKEWRFRKHILDEWIDSSIALSKGGFDLLIHSSLLEIRQSKLTESEMDQILKEALE